MTSRVEYLYSSIFKLHSSSFSSSPNLRINLHIITLFIYYVLEGRPVVQSHYSNTPIGENQGFMVLWKVQFDTGRKAVLMLCPDWGLTLGLCLDPIQLRLSKHEIRLVGAPYVELFLQHCGSLVASLGEQTTITIRSECIHPWVNANWCQRFSNFRQYDFLWSGWIDQDRSMCSKG